MGVVICTGRIDRYMKREHIGELRKRIVGI